MLTGIGELGVLGKESVAWMDGVGAAVEGGVYDLLDVQVGVLETAVTQRIGFVGHAPVQGGGVVVGKYGHAFDMQSLEGLHDPYGDFSAVGDQDLIYLSGIHLLQR